MFRRFLTLVIIALVFLGSTQSSALSSETGDDFEKTLEGLKRQFKEFSDDVRKIPEGREFKKLEKKLKDLLEQMKRSEKGVREKIQKEILPRLEREMEKLREWLDKPGPEEEAGPLEVHTEKIRAI